MLAAVDLRDESAGVSLRDVDEAAVVRGGGAHGAAPAPVALVVVVPDAATPHLAAPPPRPQRWRVGRARSPRPGYRDAATHPRVRILLLAVKNRSKSSEGSRDYRAGALPLPGAGSGVDVKRMKGLEPSTFCMARTS